MQLPRQFRQERRVRTEQILRKRGLFFHHALRAVQSQQMRIRHLPTLLVHVRRLTKQRRIALDIEQIVLNLKRYAQRRAVTMHAQPRRLIRPRDGCARLGCPGKQRARLLGAKPVEFLFAVFGLLFQIAALAADHPGNARRARQRPHRMQVFFACACARKHRFKRPGEQPVARQQRHALPVHLVVRGFAAAQIVVVHLGHIVVNERIGVYHLQRARKRKRFFDAAAERLARRQQHNRPDALSARQQAVFHCAPQRLGRRTRAAQTR